jgi:NAD+ dependent glucose-6-phosphate dehydrogenase
MPTLQPGAPTVAITGAGGMIGQVVQRLLADRYRLRPLLHRRTATGPGIDLEDLAGLVAAFEGVDVVLHLAGAAQVESTWDDVLAANIVGVRNVYEAAAQAGVGKVVFASSNHVVGAYEQAGAPDIYRRKAPTLDEHTEIRADSVYGVSKAFGELLGRYYVDDRGLAVICVRIGSVRADDDPAPAEIAGTALWLDLTPDEKGERLASTWMSQRDCVALLAAAIDTPIRWAIVYGVSDNPSRIWSLESARELLGFRPSDRSDRR